MNNSTWISMIETQARDCMATVSVSELKERRIFTNVFEDELIRRGLIWHVYKGIYHVVGGAK